MIDVAIVGHVDRADQCSQLQHDVGGALFLDDGSLGEWANHERALEHLVDHASDETRWALILQDDAQPIPGFFAHLNRALRHAPDTCVSLYVGTSRPPQWMAAVDRATATADGAGAAWLECSTLLWGVGIAIPIDHIKPLLTWATRSQLPYDQRIGAWYRNVHRRVRYTWPSLVDHADGPTLVQHADGHPRDQPRRARRVGVPAAWATVSIAID
jgi:hypothetical protein